MREKRTYEKQKEHGEDMSYESEVEHKFDDRGQNDLTKTIEELVKKQVQLAKDCGCHGVVCAGSDLKFVKRIFKGEIVTPGIRLKGDNFEDQKRVMTPQQAFKNGSSALVMGRSIIKGNIKKNILRLIKELK